SPTWPALTLSLLWQRQTLPQGSGNVRQMPGMWLAFRARGGLLDGSHSGQHDSDRAFDSNHPGAGRYRARYFTNTGFRVDDCQLTPAYCITAPLLSPCQKLLDEL